MNHNFGEKEVEIIKGKELPVWQTPKYLKSKEKAIEMIESGKYNLDDGDFWILQNTYANGTKVMYSGLIISHNGCLKINDSIENKFKPECFHVEPNRYGGLIGVYQDADTFEFGEVSEKNCRNDYPYAMVLKRTMDRVILKKSKLAFYGVYSDSESDEFKEKFIEFWKFIVGRAFTMVLEFGLDALLFLIPAVSASSTLQMVVKMFITVIVVVLNFFISKFFSFKKVSK